jgi:peptidoglycan hydrolase-like protein with peptidoglycan-binding domain
MAPFRMAEKNVLKILISVFLGLALTTPFINFVSAENTYGECDYSNESYNENCPIQTRPKTGRSGNPLPVANFTPQSLSTFVFTRDLQSGAEGEDVRALQKLLNNLGFKVSDLGPGAPGGETTRFGAATRAALIRFQIAKNISPAFGYFGPLTRAALTGSTQTMAVATPPATPSTNNASAFTRNLYLGDSGEDVRALQSFLNTHGFGVAATGPGSLGNETAFFGPATFNAVKKFQEAYASEILAPQGRAVGNGVFGPSTREKVNSLR